MAVVSSKPKKHKRCLACTYNQFEHCEVCDDKRCVPCKNQSGGSVGKAEILITDPNGDHVHFGYSDLLGGGWSWSIGDGECYWCDDFEEAFEDFLLAWDEHRGVN